jgi:hypothetical protein
MRRAGKQERGQDRGRQERFIHIIFPNYQNDEADFE